ncbi:unnamed protein product [Prorocentrum cordatum]|uniref:RRM domain-containing protein n=1 Tax=Prorocentrum cordatum TaxID=2364126 RepID=A0ABN9W6A3_9DINO|nr:unnamed protein product [Polarella glacialis]
MRQSFYSLGPYWEAAGALEALRLDGDEYWGRPLRVELKRDVDARSGAEAFVSGLRPGTSEEAVREFFRGCGEILSARLPKDQDNRSKGVAFITFLSEAALSSALGLSGKLLDGRELTVGKARRMDQPKGAKGSKGGRSKNGGAKGGGKEKGKRDGKGSGKGRGGKGGRSDR